MNALLIVMLIAFVILVWTAIGYIINVIAGYLTAKELIKYYDSKHDMDRDLMIRNYEKTGSVDISNAELILDALAWPLTLYNSWKGQKKIIAEMKEKEGK